MSGWMILLIVGGVLATIAVPIIILIALMVPAVRTARDVAQRASCMGNLKQIGLALHNYHDTYGSFPPAYVADKQGKPMHSWRVLILPFLGESALYKQYDLTKSWDSPENSNVLHAMPAVYRCPGDAHQAARSDSTSFAAAYGPDCIFAGATTVRIAGIRDGTSQTIMVGEAARAAIPWTKPADINVSEFPLVGDPQGFSSNHEGGSNFVLADASVRFIANDTPEITMRALYTRDGGETIPSF